MCVDFNCESNFGRIKKNNKTSFLAVNIKNSVKFHLEINYRYRQISFYFVLNYQRFQTNNGCHKKIEL